MVGLHRAYNSGAVLKDLASDPSLHFSFYEDIFLEEQLSFNDAVDSALRHTAGKPAGIELDLDCIKGVLSSAVTPSGIDVLQARQYLHHCMRKADVAYVHITEGAVRLRDGREDISTAKLIAYLIRDVITASK
jgi:formiminoglutamase